MKEFDFYQIVGIIAPGMLTLVCFLFFFYPDDKFNLEILINMNFGSFGFGLILSYIIGQLVQSIGYYFEKVYWWFWGGQPTDWVRSNKRELLPRQQKKELENAIGILIQNRMFDINERIDKRYWKTITRQIYASLIKAEFRKRIDIFNGNYGLFRGIAITLIICSIGLLVKDISNWKSSLVILPFIFISIIRMHRFGKLYAIELYLQFISIR